MKRIAGKRELVKRDSKIEIKAGLVEELLEAGEGQVLGKIREEMFGLLKLLIERTMQLELELLLGYAPYEKERDGSNSRNGYRERKKLVLKEGLLEGIKIPRDREGEYQTKILPRLKRYEPDLMGYMQQLYLNCNSTRPLSQMVSQLFNWPMSHNQVSVFSQELDKEVEQWKQRPLKDIYVALFLDAVWLPLRRYHQKSEKECMLLALAVTQDGHKEVVGMKLVAEESLEGWQELLRELKARGLKGQTLALAVTDGVKGFKELLRRVFPGLAIQRCIVHKERNVLKYVSHQSKEEIGEALRNIYSSTNAMEATRRKEEFCDQWRKIFPSAVRSLEDDFEDSITYLKLKNYQLRKLFYSNNPIERVNKEIKRRVRVMEMLPAEETAYRVVYWVIQKLTKSWTMYKVRGYAGLANLKREFTH